MGRDPDSDIHLGDARVSRDHLVLDGTGPVWQIEDLASKNGTRINGLPVHRAAIDRRVWISVGGLPIQAEPIGAGQLRTDRDTRNRIQHAANRVRQALDPGLAGELLIRRCLEAARRLADCERAGLWLIDRSGKRELVRIIGDRQPPLSQGVIGQVLETGRPVFCSDTAGAEALARRESVIAGGIRAVMALPLKHDQRLLGALYADSRQPGKLFTELDGELLMGIADQLRLILASTHLHSAIESLRVQNSRARGFPDSEFQRLLDQVFTPYRAG